MPAGSDRLKEAGGACRSSWVLSAGALGVLVVGVQLLPSLPMYFSMASSMALGTLVAAVLILIGSLYNDVLAKKLGRRSQVFTAGAVLFPLLVAALVFLHGFLADYMRPLDLGRFIESLVPLIVILLGGMALGRGFALSSRRALDAVVRVSFWILCAVIVLRVVRLQPRPNEFAKSFFPFTETSHFALAFSPVLLYRCVRSDKFGRYLWVLAGLAIAVFVQSLTLMAVCFLAAAASRRGMFLTALLGAGGAILLIAAGVSGVAAYYIHRLDFSGAVLNLSNLVYIQGWEQLAESLAASHWWGLGFQQFGVHGSGTAVSAIIRALAKGRDLNVLDGSFVLAKLGGEFGLFGLVAAAGFVYAVVRSMIDLRRGASDAAETFANCVVVGYFIDMFVRGTGYFTESSLLFIAALSALHAIRRDVRAEQGSSATEALSEDSLVMGR